MTPKPVTKTPSTSTLPGTENIYGMAPSTNDTLKQQMNDLYKLLETSLVDIEKPAGLEILGFYVLILF